MRSLPQPGSHVQCRIHGVTLEGTFVTSRDGKAVIKLDSGYNIGVDPSSLGAGIAPPPVELQVTRIEQNSHLPECTIISTGGTIASRIDYRTGAVTSQFSADDILRAIPGLGTIARYRTHQISSILSENMHVGIWIDLARAIYREIADGVQGIIVTHGTDTMAFTASAVSFMVESPVPIIFVGSQRSADRPSSDNVMNAVCSAQAAVSPLGEVAVVMHASTSDDRCAIHRATRVRKMHTSRRNAFQSIGMHPLGYIEYPSLSLTLSSDAIRRGNREPHLTDQLEKKVALISFTPGMPQSILPHYSDYRGLVVAGTGLGHVSSGWVPAIRELVEGGTTVVMTSQCLHGRVCDRVYDTGRDLLAAGIIEGEDMLPETALVKLAWVLGQERGPEQIRVLMQENLRGEIQRRSLHGL